MKTITILLVAFVFFNCAVCNQAYHLEKHGRKISFYNDGNHSTNNSSNSSNNTNNTYYCKPKNSWLYANCSECVPCGANFTCEDGSECVSQMNYMNYNSFCGGPYVTDNASNSSNQTTDVGFCKPACGWLLGSCGGCERCVNDNCTGADKKCYSSMQCGSWGKYCGANHTIVPDSWCRPDDGTWMFGKCQACQHCSQCPNSKYT